MLWLPIKIKVNNEEIVVSSLANSGYGTDSPEIAIPWKLAHKLNLPQKFEPKIEVEKYNTPGGDVDLLKIRSIAEITLIDGNVKINHADIVISEHLTKVLLSDKLLSELKVIIIDPYEGIWRLKSDPVNKLRKSAPPEYW